MKTFRQLKRFLSNIENIHYGGCGIATLAMYRFLVNKGENCSIAYLHKRYDLSCAINNLNYYRDNTNNPDAANHVCLFYNGQFMDCSDVLNPSEYKFIIFGDEEMLVKSIETAFWNPSFDRDVNIPLIEEFLGFSLNIKK